MERATVTDATSAYNSHGKEYIRLRFEFVDDDDRFVVWHDVRVPEFSKLLGLDVDPKQFIGVTYDITLGQQEGLGGREYTTVTDLWRVDDE